MQAAVLSATSHTATIELINEYCYIVPYQYEIFVNNENFGRTRRNVVTICGLESEKRYLVEICDGPTNKNVRLSFETEPEGFAVNVKDFGAKGDGRTLDTFAVQAAISSCPEGGTVIFPSGTYLLTPIFLKSNINIEIHRDAVLLGAPERSLYPILPGLLYSKYGDFYLSSWEGEPAESFASLITGINVENVRITGQGVIDANARFDTWWFNAKMKSSAWRPRTIFLNGCKNILIEGITIKNSPSWTVHLLFCENVKLLTLKIENPSNSPNTDGINPESCKNILIAGCEISVGDDCVAIKSGRYETSKKFGVPSQDIEVRNCFMKHGHGGVVIGSEMSSGIKNIRISNCLFVNTDRGLRIKTRRGRGGYVDEISLENVQMDGVFVPITINCFYNCGSDYDPSYSSDKVDAAVDDRTPYIGTVSIKNVSCKNIKSMATFVYGLPERKVKRINLEKVRFEISQNCEPFKPEMFDGAETICQQGMWMKNVEEIILKDVEIEILTGEKLIARNVDRLIKEE